MAWAVRGLHLSWYTISTLAVLGWLLSAILYPTSLAVFEGCDVGGRLLDNSTFFNITLEKFVVRNTTTGEATDHGEQVKDILYTCYWGNGELIEALNLTQVFKIFKNVFSPLDQVASLSTSVGPVVDSYVIPQQQEFVRGIQYGLMSDSQEMNDDLTTLNSLSNPTVNPCTQVRDTWVLNSTICPATPSSVFSAGNSADFNVLNPTCIGLDAWKHGQINKRYTTTTFLASCGLKNGLPESVYLQNFVNNLADAKDSSASIFNGVQLSL